MKMNINEMVVDSFKDVEIGRIFTTQEAKDVVVKKYNINPSSFLPSDVCYNRTNKGIERTPSYNRPDSRIFMWIKRGVYRYVGPNYVMKEGEYIYSNPRK